jgi:hypothetical protein
LGVLEYMEYILPDIESFKPWELDDNALDRMISDLHDELRGIHKSERTYKIDLVFALKRLRDQKKMNDFFQKNGLK